MADYRCNEQRRAAGMAAPAECRRCGPGPCTHAVPAADPPALRPDAAATAEAPVDVDCDTLTDELRGLLLDLVEFLGDRPQTDVAAMALYRRVLEMLGQASQ